MEVELFFFFLVTYRIQGHDRCGADGRMSKSNNFIFL